MTVDIDKSTQSCNSTREAIEKNKKGKKIVSGPVDENLGRLAENKICLEAQLKDNLQTIDRTKGDIFLDIGASFVPENLERAIVPFYRKEKVTTVTEKLKVVSLKTDADEELWNEVHKRRKSCS